MTSRSPPRTRSCLTSRTSPSLTFPPSSNEVSPLSFSLSFSSPLLLLFIFIHHLHYFCLLILFFYLLFRHIPKNLCEQRHAFGPHFILWLYPLPSPLPHLLHSSFTSLSFLPSPSPADLFSLIWVVDMDYTLASTYSSSLVVLPSPLPLPFPSPFFLSPSFSLLFYLFF